MAPEEQNPKLLSPLTLAFVGDGVYELLVRKRIVEAGSMPPKKLNAHKVEMVRASAQAAVYDGRGTVWLFVSERRLGAAVLFV